MNFGHDLLQEQQKLRNEASDSLESALWPLDVSTKAKGSFFLISLSE